MVTRDAVWAQHAAPLRVRAQRFGRSTLRPYRFGQSTLRPNGFGRSTLRPYGPEMNSFIIKNATVLTMDAEHRRLDGIDVLVEDGRITQLGSVKRTDLDLVDATDCVLLPGFVQPHLHLCQTLFRNLADDLVLIDWLKTRIWPFEAAHNPASLRASAELGIAELIRSGTTCVLDMGTVNHTDAIGRAVQDSGLRATIGKCLMDHGDEVPAAMLEDRGLSLAESDALFTRWDGAADGRIRYAFTPRFVHSCTEGLLVEAAQLARDRGAILHTHSSETRFEIAETLRLHGQRNVEYLHACGLTGPRSVFAHGVWLDDAERQLLSETQTRVVHCPSSNLKLGSGIADILALWAAGVEVGLASDGAPCNNTLDAQSEMRLAALIQKSLHGPTAMPAARVLRMATIDGARVLGLDAEIGSVEVGKRADLVMMRLNRIHNGVAGELESRIVYASFPENVDSVWVDGHPLLRDGVLATLDEAKVFATAKSELQALLERVEGA